MWMYRYFLYWLTWKSLQNVMSNYYKIPLRHILYPELPCIGLNVHVCWESLVISVACNSMSQKMNVSVSNPRHSPQTYSCQHFPKWIFKKEVNWAYLFEREPLLFVCFPSVFQQWFMEHCLWKVACCLAWDTEFWILFFSCKM